MSIKKEGTYKEYIPNDETVERASYESEFSFYETVKSGNVEEIKNNLKNRPFSSKKDWGILSINQNRNQIYHFVITAAILARICMEGGMNLDDAYSLSDYYIQKADKSKTTNELDRIHYDMVLDYTSRMKETKNKIYSKPVSKCINYIYNHLNEPITTNDLSSYIGLSRAYLSTIFKKETGSSINDYIIYKKLQTAENMLKYSDYTISEISNILSFSSQSYFTKLFKKHNGETPKKYATKLHSVLTKKP